MPSDSNAQFPPTSWSRISRARRIDEPDAAAAIDDLYTQYWRPCYAFLRKHGHDAEEAQRLTTDFSSVFFFEKATFESVDRSKGTFRSFLKGCLKLFVKDARRTERRAHKVGAVPIANMDFATVEAEIAAPGAEPADPDAAFSREFHLSLMAKAWDGVRADFQKRGHGAHFDAIRTHLTSTQPRCTRDELAAQLKLSLFDVMNLIDYTKNRLKTIVRAAIRETVDSPEKIDEELRDLSDTL